jgi:DtxR family transcriptional regulator, Mn-dependent transcriptional regulator
MEQELSITLEDYLYTIYGIEVKQRVVRPRDICRARNVVPSTVTAALQSLSDKGLINYEPHELITLTSEGRKRGEELVLRHRIIQDFFENILALPPESANASACRIERAIDADVQERFICFLAFLESHSPTGKKWIRGFRRFIENGTDCQKCRESIEQYIKSISDTP